MKSLKLEITDLGSILLKSDLGCQIAQCSPTGGGKGKQKEFYLKNAEEIKRRFNVHDELVEALVLAEKVIKDLTDGSCPVIILNANKSAKG